MTMMKAVRIQAFGGPKRLPVPVRDDGKVRVPVARVFPRAEARAAQAVLPSGKVIGKIVLRIGA